VLARCQDITLMFASHGIDADQNTAVCEAHRARRRGDRIKRSRCPLLAFGGKADVAADDLEGDAMRLLGDGGQSDKAVVWPPSLFAYRQGPVSRSGHGACIAAVEDDCVISYSIVEPTRRTISGPCTAK
jgi:hypothetical protein